MNLTCRVLENDVGEYTCVHRHWIMRAKSDPHVKRSIDVQMNRGTELVHRLSFYADEQCEVVPMFFDSDALGHNSRKQAACDTILHIFDHSVFLETRGHVDHSRAVFGYHDLLRIVIEVLPDHQHDFAVVRRLGDREAYGCGE